MSSIRRFSSIAVLIGFGFLALGAVVAYALPNEIDTIYFSNASHTTMVGERDRLCNGSLFSWGTTSPYYERFVIPCH